MPAAADPPPRALLVSADPVLRDELTRMAAAAGLRPQLAGDPAAARAGWRRAAVVLVGGDLADAVATAGLPHRDGVVLVTGDLDDAGVWQRGVRLGCRNVVFLPDAAGWLFDFLADAAEPPTGSAVAVGVIGGRGGAGASTLAVALAVTGARRGWRTMLVDADPAGGGIDLLLGGEDVPGRRWPELAAVRGRVPGESLRAALPRVRELTVLSWDRGPQRCIPPDALAAVLDAGLRGSDLVVVDLPRRLDPAARVAAAAVRLVLLVVPAQLRATAAAVGVAGEVAGHCADVRLVVRGPGRPGLDGNAMASALGLPLAGVLRPEPRLDRDLDLGEPPARHGRGPLARFCAGFLAGLSGPVPVHPG